MYECNKEITAGYIAHREKYAELVNSRMVDTILSNKVTMLKLLSSEDLYFNDVTSLSYWDHGIVPKLGIGPHSFPKGYSLSMGVCIAKEAARQAVEKRRKTGFYGEA